MATPPWLEGLEGEDVPRLIQSDSSKIRVVAGPGSGKTTGLKRRVQRLLQTEDTDPESIFVGTFTRAITEDLEEDLTEYAEQGVTVSTLHSHALQLLRENPGVLAGRVLRFLLEYEQQAMLYDVRERTGDERDIYELEDHLRRLQAANSKRRTFDDAEFSGAVRRWLREHESMLISEVVPIVTRALEGQDLPQGRFDHVVIDEYQDLTRCEQVMVELIWSGEGSLVVLGDDLQSIYDFRYNHPDGISSFLERHPDLEDISIEENRRSGREIVYMANLIMQEAGADRDPMRSTRQLDGQTTLVHWPSVQHEVEGVAEYIQHRQDQDFLVLVPRKFIGYRLRDAIGEPDARTHFREEVLETPLAEARFALATVLADPEDRVGVRTWLGAHWDSGRGGERNAPAYLSVFDPGLSAPELIDSIASGARNPSGDGQKNVSLRAQLLLEELEDAPENIRDQLDYLFDPSLSLELDDEDDAARAARDLETLREGAHEVREEIENPTLQQVLEWIRYRIVTRVPLADPDDQARVRIMTLHSVKGLEADVIVVAGAADEMIPGPDQDPEERAEQRRLLYVAITRARNELLISWPHRVRYGDARQNRVRLNWGDIERWRAKTYFPAHRTSLLPDGGPQPSTGQEWLQEETGG